jgi:hypothetical protein
MLRKIGRYSKNWGSIPGKSKRFFFFTVSGLALGPTQALIQWVMGASSTEEKHLKLEADHSCHVMLNLRRGGAVPPLPHMFMYSS